jgi:hypothetical protein
MPESLLASACASACEQFTLAQPGTGGVAVVLAAIGGTPVQRVDVARLQQRLAEDG